jgi:hypothetical protein
MGVNRRVGMGIVVMFVVSIVANVIASFGASPTDIPPDWVHQAAAGEVYSVADAGAVHRIWIDQTHLVFEQGPRWLPLAVLLPVLLGFLGICGLLLFNTATGDTLLVHPIVDVVVIVPIACFLVVMMGMSTREREVHIDRASLIVHDGYVFGFIGRKHVYELPVDAAARQRRVEECAQLDDGDVCFQYVVVDISVTDGWMRLIRLAHSKGARSAFDAAQVERAERLVAGIDAYVAR